MQITVNKMERQHTTQVYGQGAFAYENKRAITVYVDVVLDNQTYFKSEFTFTGIDDISFSKAAELVQEHLKHGIA
ncbi:hypothetical protein NSQ76_16095 [Bacillus sp. FSL M8-0256]|uniref:hypothetical protein n=1 Tax=Bacillus TaxID=1386 RepID=UPI0011A17841|nr:hypothetical protein [Bacillus altitudinis]MCY7690881.1 hypothetical protein [Bacillus altitudinis]